MSSLHLMIERMHRHFREEEADTQVAERPNSVLENFAMTSLLFVGLYFGIFAAW